ncbi:hypothetical protein B9Z55_023318 [Caenorhabditis nigoni]|uniref:Homeobox domain-containing protein n=1 Tax=Caenorhabditis nigoni TaxID=1611254 RepID=A0A2G5SP80_9PELO|nr:hypothetical protein B9Z55_023318 [Caenorhabditis nigoni]
MVNRSDLRSHKASASTEGTSSGAHLKRSRPASSSGSDSEQEVQMGKRRPGRRCQDATLTEGTRRKAYRTRSRRADSSELDSENDIPVAKRCFSSDSETEDDAQQSRPKRKSARHIDYEESDTDFEDDSSSSEPEFQYGDSVNFFQFNTVSPVLKMNCKPFSQRSALEEETENEQAEEPVPVNIANWKRTKKGANENGKPRVRFSPEQVQVLQALFDEIQHPSKEQRKKAAEDTNLRICQVNKWFVSKRRRYPELVKSLPGKRERDSNKPSRFKAAMETFFEKRQFLGKPDKDLELESGGSWDRISKWLDKKRYATLKAFIRNEITVLPNEMETSKRLMEKYCLDVDTHEDVYLYIEMKENVNGDNLAQYLIDWDLVLKVFKRELTKEFYIDQEEVNLADSHDVEYLNEPELDYHMNENRREEAVAHHEENEMERQNDRNGIETPNEAAAGEELHGQIDGPVPENHSPEVKDIQLFENPGEDNQNAQLANHIQNEVDDFRDETKDVPLFDPAPAYQEDILEPIEHVEGNKVHLFVYDVDHRDEPDEIPAHGPVSVHRVAASYDDLVPYLGDIIGFKEIGLVTRTDIAEAKRNLNDEYTKGLILPFNCCLDYKKWTKIQVMEFFSQLLFIPTTIKKLVMKISTGAHLSMFQEEGYFEELNKEASIIDLYEFSIIHREIEKLNRFQ